MMAFDPLKEFGCLRLSSCLMKKSSFDRQNTSFWQSCSYLQRRWVTTDTPEPASSSVTTVTGQRTTPSLPYCQEPAQPTDTVGLTASFFLSKVDQSLTFQLHKKISHIFWVWRLKTDVALCSSQRLTTSAPNKAIEVTMEDPGLSVQVASKSVSF